MIETQVAYNYSVPSNQDGQSGYAIDTFGESFIVVALFFLFVFMILKNN